MITACLVDSAIDKWETEFGRSTIKNTVSALTRLSATAIIASNPAKDRARRRPAGPLFPQLETERHLALPNVAILEQLVTRSPLGVIEGST